MRRRVSYTTQAPSVYLDLSVRENLRYFARILDAPAERIDEVLRTVDLAPLAGHVVGRLSGGEQARVSLGTALLGNPELLVLDEPTVGLDPVLRRELWSTFAELARRRGDVAGVESRHERGRAVRQPRAPPRRPPAGRGHGRRDPSARRNGGHGRRLPAARRSASRRERASRYGHRGARSHPAPARSTHARACCSSCPVRS